MWWVEVVQSKTWNRNKNSWSIYNYSKGEVLLPLFSAKILENEKERIIEMIYIEFFKKLPDQNC